MRSSGGFRGANAPPCFSRERNSTACPPTAAAASRIRSTLHGSTISGAFTNDGAVTMPSNQTVTLGANGTVLNRGEWTMNAASGQACNLNGNCSSFTATFTNQGTLRATGAGVKVLNTSCSPLVFASTGAVLAESGELRTNCNATLTAGAVVSAGATLTNQSALTLGAPITGAGQFQSTSGTLTMPSAIALPITRTDDGPIIGDLPEVSGLVVLVIDDGVETGSVARAAAIALRDASPSRLILAVPVCSREAMAHLSHLYDQIIAVDMPLGRRSLAWHYTTFDTIDDETAERLLNSQ